MDNKYLRILIVEDSLEDTELVILELQRNGYKIDYQRVETAAAMKHALDQNAWDLVLSDYSLPHFDAPHALDTLKSSAIDIPFIILSGTIGEESAIAALKAGAHDFIIKGNYARLVPAIERELRDAHTRREHREATAALVEKERLLSEAQRIGHIGSCSYDITTGLWQFSEEMYKLLDISPEEFDHTNQSFIELIYSLDRPIAAQWIKDILNGKRPREFEFRILHKNGELRYMLFRGALLFQSAETADRFVGTMQDVTERKLAEIQIRQQVDHLMALRKIDQAITSNFNLHTVLDTVISQTIAQLQVDAADILLLREEEQILEYAAGQGFRSAAINGTQVRIGEEHAGHAASEKRLIHIDDMRIKPFARPLPGEDFISYFGVPLISKGKVKGVLEVLHRSMLHPYPEWVDFLETLAGQAAIAVDNATLFESLQRSNRELEMAYDTTIAGWSQALDLRDQETEGHTIRVTEMTLELARMMKLSEEELVQIKRGGLLHDIGKMAIPDKILRKEGPLTHSEWMIMRKHPQLAYELLSPIGYLKPALDIPYCHHEKWDGTGYPRGLKGEEIPLCARIFAVVDVWDALTSDRPYRPGWSTERTLQHIRSNSGIHFDPQIVDVFIEYMSRISNGNS
jgi:putative nucleotidyltransferase with HDIG domain/PAS domain S-box-containing protein